VLSETLHPAFLALLFSSIAHPKKISWGIQYVANDEEGVKSTEITPEEVVVPRETPPLKTGTVPCIPA